MVTSCHHSIASTEAFLPHELRTFRTDRYPEQIAINGKSLPLTAKLADSAPPPKPIVEGHSPVIRNGAVRDGRVHSMLVNERGCDNNWEILL